MTIAQEEARKVNACVDSDHILIGLIREEYGLAARALSSLDVIDDSRLRKSFKVFGQRNDGASHGPMSHAPGVKTVLEHSLSEALSLGHNYIGTEHILLGLVYEDVGPGTSVLIDLLGQHFAERVRQATLRLLIGAGRQPEKEAPPRRDMWYVYTSDGEKWSAVAKFSERPKHTIVGKILTVQGNESEPIAFIDLGDHALIIVNTEMPAD